MLSKIKYNFLERLNINNIYNSFLGLPPQQQTVAMIISGVIAIFLILLPISLASSKIGRMEKMLSQNSSDMDAIVDEIDRLNSMREQLRGIEDDLRRGFDTSLSTTIEALGDKNNIKESIDSIKERPMVPSELFDESIVEVRLSKVTLQQLIDFLYSIEYDKSKLLRVKELSMRTRFDNKQLFDATFQVSTYRLQEG